MKDKNNFDSQQKITSSDSKDSEVIKNITPQEKKEENGLQNSVKSLKDGEGEKVKDNRSYIEVIYDEIVKVIGGDNSSQYFMMTFPAQVINKKDYEYDIDNNSPKGPVVEANESRLANKLFDPCQITASDNGMFLSSQYKTALDILTPKLDRKTAVNKEKLRSLLLTKYPYDFGNGLTNNQTLQNVYFELYDEYVEANKNWVELQNNKKSEIRKKYSGGTEEDNQKAKDEYLTWYETVAQAELTALNEKYSKVLSVFSPTDMDILEGVLDSGSGAELENAKRILRNYVKQSPGGGDIYPVNFMPSNWFKYLEDESSQIDLLESPDILGTEISQLTVKRNFIINRLNSMNSLLKDEDIDAINKEIEATQKSIDDTFENVFSGIADNIKNAIKGVIDVVSVVSSSGVIKNIFENLGADTDPNTVTSFMDTFEKNRSQIMDAQSKINQDSVHLAELYSKKLDAGMQSEYANIIADLNNELSSINDELNQKKANLAISAAIDVPSGDTESANPYNVPKGFTQILIEVEGSSAVSSKLSDSSSLVSNSKSWYLFGSSEYNSKSAQKNIDDELSKSGSKIQIGMNIIKIGIEREWFNPGIFLQTKNMYNVSNVRVSAKSDDSSVHFDDVKDFLNQINNDKNEYILPCFPVSMIIARDVVIKYTTSSEESSYVMSAMHNESTKGNSIFGFGKTSSTVSDFSSSNSKSQMSSKSITIRFNTPQILGYYIEITPPDMSEIIGEGSEYEMYENIGEYVDSYKKMLKEINENFSADNKGDI